MPIIDVSIRKGRDPQQLNELMRALHDAAQGVLQVPDASIRVLLREIDAEHWMAGGITLAEAIRAADENK